MNNVLFQKISTPSPWMDFWIEIPPPHPWPSRNSSSASYFCLKILAFETPTPLEFLNDHPWGEGWIFSGTTQSRQSQGSYLLQQPIDNDNNMTKARLRNVIIFVKPSFGILAQIYFVVNQVVVPENIQTPTTEGHWRRTLEEEEGLKGPNFQGKCEPILEFPEGWGFKPKTLHRRSMNIFWNNTF